MQPCKTSVKPIKLHPFTTSRAIPQRVTTSTILSDKIMATMVKDMEEGHILGWACLWGTMQSLSTVFKTILPATKWQQQQLKT